jgi:Fe-S cluster assembly ATP-binding protein
MLRIENLSVAIGERKVLSEVNLHIHPGEIHVLFGPNGSGKSTLLGAIMGFARYRILQGRIYFKGEDITNLPVNERAMRGLGIMVQRPPTVRGVSLRQLTGICARNREIDVEKMADVVNMRNFMDRNANEGFSGGEIKRSELLQLMAQNPDFLMLDEPESGVDLENIALVGQAINIILERKDAVPGRMKNTQKYNREKSGLIITHTGHILQYVPADFAHVIYNETISCSGNPIELLDCISKSGYEACVTCAVEGDA